VDDRTRLFSLSVAQLSLFWEPVFFLYLCDECLLSHRTGCGTKTLLFCTETSFLACMLCSDQVCPPIMLLLGLCQLEQQVKSSPPPRMLDMEEGNQPVIIICCSGTRAPPWAVLSGVPVYSLLLQVQVLGYVGKSPGTVLLWLAPESLGHEEPLTFVWFLPGSCLLLTWVVSA
jgi:hypothetical protein